MRPELEVVVGIGGASGAGKTTLARALAERHAVRRASFSDVLRRDAAVRGLEPTRRNLQDLGLERIDLGWPSFVTAVTGLLGWPPVRPAVIEGFRHTDAVNCCSIATGNVPLLFVYLAADQATRELRLTRRQFQSEATRSCIDEHEVESEAGTLDAIADLVLRPAPIPDLMNEIESAAMAKIVDAKK